MDGMEKVGLGVVLLTIGIMIAFLGLGAWGFIELIQWITSK